MTLLQFGVVMGDALVKVASASAVVVVGGDAGVGDVAVGERLGVNQRAGGLELPADGGKSGDVVRPTGLPDSFLGRPVVGCSA